MHKIYPCPNGIRTRYPSGSVVADTRLRPRGSWCRPQLEDKAINVRISLAAAQDNINMDLMFIYSATIIFNY